MSDHSLNTIAWNKLKKNKLAFFSLIFIMFCFFGSVFAVFLSPDRTPMANEMHIELSKLKPLTKIDFLHLNMQVEDQSSLFSKWFIGKISDVKRIPLSSYTEFQDTVRYFSYQSTIEEVHIGKYQIIEQIFWLGTDIYGRDMLSRMIHGTRISFSVGIIAVFISLIIGITLGLLAGYYRGFIDSIIMWFVNVIWSIPTLLMVIAISLALGKGFWQVFVAIGLTMWVEVARIVRGQVLYIRELEFVQAGKVLAYKPFRIIFIHILPNVLGPVIVISAANFASAILIESGLSFLGLGTQPPIASWGSMVKEHYFYIIMDKSYLAVIPGLAIMFLVLSFMLLGNGLRDAFDVRD